MAAELCVGRSDVRLLATIRLANNAPPRRHLCRSLRPRNSQVQHCRATKTEAPSNPFNSDLSAIQLATYELGKQTAQPQKTSGFLSYDLDALVVREVRPEEYWEAADLHCAAFFPSAPFPLDFLLRSDRVSNILAGLSIPSGRFRKCLVAIEPQSPQHGAASITNPVPPAFLSPSFLSPAKSPPDSSFDSEKDIAGGPLLRPVVASLMLGPPVVSWTSSGLNVGPRGVVASVTVDTAAEFLPPHLRSGASVAYVSNMAVRAVRRRRGIASLLLNRAEALARSWGCTRCALHCNSLDDGAVGLYRGQGYRVLIPPIGAVWPEPPVGEDQKLQLMVKELQ